MANDELLQRYIDEESELLQEMRSLRREVSKLSEKVDGCYAAANRCTTLVIQQNEDRRRHAKRLRQAELQIERLTTTSPAVPDWRPDPAEITGTHQFQKIQAEHEALMKEEDRRKEYGGWWQRQRWVFIMAIITGLTVAAAVGCTTYVVTNITNQRTSK